MLLTKRFGVVGRSIRFQTTFLATRRVFVDGGVAGNSSTPGASTFFVTNTRPVVVAAHAVPVSAAVRSIWATFPPARSPQAASIRRTWPSSAQSPHWTPPIPVHSLHRMFASATVFVPSPAVCVRYAVRAVPTNIDLLTTGSLMIGE